MTASLTNRLRLLALLLSLLHAFKDGLLRLCSLFLRS